jgi:hypothetical protein
LVCACTSTGAVINRAHMVDIQYGPSMLRPFDGVLSTQCPGPKSYYGGPQLKFNEMKDVVSIHKKLGVVANPWHNPNSRLPPND